MNNTNKGTGYTAGDKAVLVVCTLGAVFLAVLAWFGH